MQIELSMPELEICRLLGVMRRCTASGNVQDKQMGKQDPFEIDIDGVIAEYCVAKALNLCPDLTVSIRKGGSDLVNYFKRTIDVKSTRYQSGKLLATLKKEDHACDMYVLAIVNDKGAKIAGWTTKEELFKDENIDDLGHGKGYVMTQDQLNKNIHEIN